MKRAYIIWLGFVAVLVAAVLLTLPLKARWAMQGVLRDAGFPEAMIGRADRAPGGYSFGDIALDARATGSIESITIQAGDKDGTIVTVDKARLAGLPAGDGTPDLSAGLNAIADDLRRRHAGTVIVKDAQVPVAIAGIGTLQFLANGQMHILPDGAIRIQAELTGIEHPFKGVAHLTGEFSPTGIDSVDLEIEDGRVNLAPLMANRLGGWLIFNRKTVSGPWSVSAQVVAGAARLHTLPLHGLTVTAQGSTDDVAITAQAGGTPGDPVAFAVDAQLHHAGHDHLVATLRADNFTDLLRALAASAQDDDTDLTPKPARPSAPGGIVTYDATADSAGALLADGKISVADLFGKPWLLGSVRRTAAGADIDIQETPIKPLATGFGIPIAADGKLTGLVSLTRNPQGQVAIDQGLIRAIGPGTIAYTAPALPQGMQATRSDTLALLKNFAYDKLEVAVSGLLTDKISGTVTLSGRPRTGSNKTSLVTMQYEGRLQ